MERSDDMDQKGSRVERAETKEGCRVGDRLALLDNAISHFPHAKCEITRPMVYLHRNTLNAEQITPHLSTTEV
jgi:hypothetical protein